MAGQIDDFSIYKGFPGYFNNKEETDLDPRAMVKGSKNVMVSDADKIVASGDYSLLGAAKTLNNPIVSSIDWETSTGIVRNLRTYNTGTLNAMAIECFYNGNFININNSLAGLADNTKLRGRPWWDVTNKMDVLVMTLNTSQVYSWSGGIATLTTGSTTTSLVLPSGTTWASLRFLPTNTYGTAKIVVGGVGYAYDVTTVNSNTLTLLSALPSAPAAGTVVYQEFQVHSMTATGSNDFDIIGIASNHMFYGNSNSREVYMSKSGDFRDCGYTVTLRVPGEGMKITLDDVCRAFIPDGTFMTIHAGKNLQYEVQRQFTADGKGQTIEIKPVTGGNRQAAISPEAIIRAKNGIMYCTQDKTIDWLSQFAQQQNNSLPISDSIKKELIDYTTISNVSSIYFRNMAFFAYPTEGQFLIYDEDRGLWQAPQTIPISHFSIIDGKLCGHSSIGNETYEILDGSLRQNGLKYTKKARFTRNIFAEQGGHPHYKIFDEWYVEVLMPNYTTLKGKWLYEYGESDGVGEFFLDGLDDRYVFKPSSDSSLGKLNLGKAPNGGSFKTPLNLNKYRKFNSTNEKNFFEMATEFYVDGDKDYFELIAHGPNVRRSLDIPINYVD